MPTSKATILFSLPTRPTGRFDVITCIEVIEHAPSPQFILADMRSLLADDGCILIGESLQPPDIDTVRCGWWYVAPRNGHASIYWTGPILRQACRNAPAWLFTAARLWVVPMCCEPAPVSLNWRRASAPRWSMRRLCAPGQWPAIRAGNWMEGKMPGQQFQWTSEPEVSWTIEVRESLSRVLIMIPVGS